MSTAPACCATRFCFAATTLAALFMFAAGCSP